MGKAAEEKADLQWYPAFYAGLQIEFADEAKYLEFENEHQLGTKPKEIDVLVIKKNPEVAITKNIGRIFRNHNIFEYKNPQDYLSIDDFYKVHGYACFYKSDVNTVDAIKAGEITISFVTKYYPRNVIKHLQKEQNMKVTKQEQVKQQVEEQLSKSETRGKEQALFLLVKDGLLSITEAAKRLSLSEEECIRKMNLTET